MSSNGSKSTRDNQSLSYIVRSGLAGGVAGCIAKTVVAPLDRVKILFQASNPDFQKYAGSWSGAYRAGHDIYVNGGLRGLFQGHSATLLRIFPYAAIKFMAYDEVHHILMPTQQHETNIRRFLAGAISGTMSVFFTYPLEVIRVRMAFQTSSPNKSIVPGLKFYRGFTVTMIGMVPYAGVSFLSWGYLRAALLPSSKTGHKTPTPIADLAIGAVSGALAQTASYPFEVVRRRMQVGGITQPDRWLRWGETVRAVWDSKGWRGFYVGLSIGYLKVVPMTAVSFTVWQGGKRLLGV
ncbi:mitochondrial carrier domain-containing protein [Infundibulicybe gibba]|nr:mitochondrial carrier domain-containing protein [Infundibulicybe gibba]